MKNILILLLLPLLISCGGGSGSSDGQPQIIKTWDEMNWNEGEWS